MFCMLASPTDESTSFPALESVSLHFICSHLSTVSYLSMYKLQSEGNSCIRISRHIRKTIIVKIELPALHGP